MLSKGRARKGLTEELTNTSRERKRALPNWTSLCAGDGCACTCVYQAKHFFFSTVDFSAIIVLAAPPSSAGYKSPGGGDVLKAPSFDHCSFFCCCGVGLDCVIWRKASAKPTEVNRYHRRADHIQH